MTDTLDNGREFWRDLLTAGTPSERINGIARRSIEALNQAPPGQRITSTELGYKIWPKEERRGKLDKPQIDLLFDTLRRLAKDRLKDYCQTEYVPGGSTGHKKAYVWFNPNGPNGMVEPAKATTMEADAAFLRKIVHALRGDNGPVYTKTVLTRCERLLAQMTGGPEPEEEW